MLNVRAFLSRQLRRPSGPFGRLLLIRVLDHRNRDLVKSTLEELRLTEGDSFLDVGFGGGLALRLAADLVGDGPMYGADFSQDVVNVGHRRLRRLIMAGRLTLLRAGIDDMPLRAELLRGVSTINTIYFWPEPERAAQELWRVLAPGGRVAIGYTGDEKMAKMDLEDTVFTHYGPQRVEALLGAAGFEQVRSVALSGKNEGDFVTTGRRGT